MSHVVYRNEFAGDFFECDAKEAKAALLNRFVVGGGVVRYRAAHAKTVEDIVALDVALPRNATVWAETLPDGIERRIEAKSYCGHFLCHVLHQEYLVRRGENCEAIEHEILALLDERRAEYPAEHNVGHRYVAKKELADFYRSLDPTNSFNPGIGKTSKLLGWKPARETESLPS
jgi:D-lactate dehydrogenase